MSKAYSTETLAERWDCSAEKIRLMFHRGELRGFRLGKLIRFSADEVERYECLNMQSASTEESSSSSTTTPDELFDARLARMTAGSRKLVPVKSGRLAPARYLNG